MIHPACLPEELLLKSCTIQRLRRSGPGGQHRNKVETAVVIEHEPSGVRAEANERRSQAENRAVAVFRLRVALAVQHRSDWVNAESTVDQSPADQEDSEPQLRNAPLPSELWRGRISGGRISVAATHTDFPSILAEALDGVYWASWNVAQAAKRLGVSSSQLIRLLKIHPPALALVNSHRQKIGLPSLR